MWKLLCVIFFLFGIDFYATAQSYGLAFNSHEMVPEKRTALQLAPEDSLQFSNAVQIRFDLNFIPNYHVYFGYVLRIISSNHNIDLIYDQKSSGFNVVVDKTFSGISFSLDIAQLFNQWNHLQLIINPQSRKLQVAVNNKLIGTSAIPSMNGCYTFLWGANDFQRYQTRDIPPMRIKEVQLFDGNTLKYHWSLDELSGNSSKDKLQHKNAGIKNAVWIKPKHQNWELANAFSTKGNAVAAFDTKNEHLYISGADSVFVYNLKDLQNAWTAQPIQHEDILPGSLAVYDTLTDRMYNVFIDQKKIASLKPGGARWNNNFDSALTDYWHPNKFTAPADTSLYIFGGYGQLTYKNLVQRYHFATKTWDTVTTGGDRFLPRYLAALGTNSNGDTAYIIGGYGSTTGNQMLDPDNYFDMYAFDVKNRKFKKLFDINPNHLKFTFGNSLVIDSKKQEYFGLIFPNDSFHSKLQLITGSLKKPVYRVLPNAIPFSFYDLQSFADLYYAPDAGKLVAVTLLASKPDARQKFTEVKIYTLDFPPEFAQPEVIQDVKSAKPVSYVAVFLLTAGLLGAIIYYLKKKSKQNSIVIEERDASAPSEQILINTEFDEQPAREEAEAETKPVIQAGIFLFGRFQVVDKNGVDITALFTPLLKELFLLILIYTIRNGRGITPDELNDILWTGKSAKDATNNRSVNIVKLKNILEKIGEIGLVKKSGFWQVHHQPDLVYVDYEQYVSLIKHKGEWNTAMVQVLLAITEKGSFLFQTEYDWLDDLKAKISNAVIDGCLKFITTNQEMPNDPDFIIRITETIFQFDQLNEDALAYKCRSLIKMKRYALASKIYAKFIKDYKEIYGEEFSKPFNQVVENNSANSLRL